MEELNIETSLYDILDIKPDASPQEVREAYLRTKAAYGKDSVALYTLISTEEREDMLSRIEEAYEILSSADRRKEYDRRHGLLDFDEAASTPSRVPLNQKIISIDRVPPMENTRADTESLLVAPPTDFTSGTPMHSQPVPGSMSMPSAPLPANELSDSPFETSPPSPAEPAEPLERERRSGRDDRRASQPRHAESALSQEIAQEVEWRGHFLRKVREARRISIEEMSGITKVSKTYIISIEEENFPKLPAPVFMRGFVTQMAKVLRLPHEQVASAYMARYYQARPDIKPAK